MDISDLDSKFDQAVIDSKNLAERPDDKTMLQIYALYKQATSGDVEGDRPGMFDFVAAAKYDAWEKQQGKSAKQAKTDYVALIERLKG